MNTENIIEKELRELAPVLSQMKRTHPYTVPGGYFENFSQSIIATCNDDVPRFKATVPYQPPSGYFDELPATVLNNINSQQQNTLDELLTIAPVLHSLPRTNVYTVPINYFSQLNIQPVKKGSAKVVLLPVAKRVYRYASAAVITGILLVSGVLFFNKEDSTSTPNAIVQTKFSSTDLAKISEEEIAEFLNTHTSSGDVTANNAVYPDMEVEEFIQEMSDTEIQQYLKETTEPDEVIYRDL